MKRLRYEVDYMKNRKNLSIILAIVILLTQLMAENVFAGRIADSTADLTVEEEETSKLLSETHSNEFAALYGLGILKGNIESDSTVTRADFATVLYAFCREQIQGSLGFRDIDPDSELARAVMAVTNYGYMGGYGDGTFRPNENITYTQAVYALLLMAGYKDIAESEGGYPGGYLQIATRSKLLSGFSENSELTFGDLAKLLYNYLDLSVIKTEFSGEKNKSYYQSDITVMEELLQIHEGRGLVYANSNASIMGRPKTKKGEVIVDYKDKEATVSVGTSNIDRYVGYNVKYYFDDNDKIVFCRVDDGMNEVLEVDEEHFNSIDKKLSQLSYNNTTVTKSAKISDTADFIYNGTSCYGIAVSDFNDADCIRLIDNNSDGRYDVVYIYVYTSYMVKNISIKEKTIEDQRDNLFYVFDEEAREIVYEKNGYSVEFDAITEWDILNIEIGKESDSLVMVNISSDMVSGEVDQIDKAERKITIGGEEYYVSKKVNINSILLKSEFAGGLNKFGAIVCFKQMKIERDHGYAYLEEIMRDRKTDLVTLTVLNQSGNEEVLTLSEKFSINNTRSDWTGLTAYIDSYSTLGHEYGRFQADYQLMSYTLRQDGTVKNLYFAGAAKGAVDESYNNELVLNSSFSNKRMRVEFPTLNSEYLYERDTPIFVIVKDDVTNAFIKEMSCVKKRDTLKLNGTPRPTVKIYDAGKDRIAKALVFELKKSEITTYFDNQSNQGFLVTKIRTVLNDDDEVVKEVVGIKDGLETRYMESELYDFSGWQVGDLWLTTIDLNYHVIDGKKLFELLPAAGSSTMSPQTDYSSIIGIRNLDSPTGATSDYTEYRTGVYGTLRSVINTDSTQAIRIRPEGSTEDVIYGISGTSIVIYNSQSETFEPISFEHLSVGTGKIFCYTRYGFCRDIIIIK
jgi:hypothetical protein